MFGLRLILIVLFCLVDVPRLLQSESTEAFDDLGQAIHRPCSRRLISSIRCLTRHCVRRPQTELRLLTVRASRTTVSPGVRPVRPNRKIPLPVPDLPSQSDADYSLV